MMKNKKGFTIIEVIVSIALLAIVGALFSITIVKKNNNKSNTDEEKLKSAISVLSEQLESSNSLNRYVANNLDKAETSQDLSFFCLSKNAILSSGVIDENNSIIKEWNDNKYIKVSKDKTGSISFETNVDKEECKYQKATITNDDKKEISFGNTDDGDDYIFDAEIKQSGSVGNMYSFNLKDFKYKVKTITSSIIPVDLYTVFILDGSGSMEQKGYDKVTAATWNLYNNLNDNNNYHMKKYSVVSFGTNVYNINGVRNDLEEYNGNSVNLTNPAKSVEVICEDSTTCFSLGVGTNSFPFSDTISENYFNYHSGSNLGTYYSNPLRVTYDMLKDIPKDYTTNDNIIYNRFIIVFLTDGRNIETGNYLKQYQEALDNIKNFLNPNEDNEYGKLITVGYNYKSDSSVLQNISSTGCNDNNNCYYPADSTDVEKVFEGFENVINKTVNTTIFKDVVLRIDLGDGFTHNGNTYIEKKINLDYGEDIADEITSLLKNVKFNIVFTPTGDAAGDYTFIEGISLKLTKSSGDIEKINFNDVVYNVKLGFSEEYATND